MHYGVPGMKWGSRKDKRYHSTCVRSAIARRQNDKIDKSFKDWKENAKKRENAVTLGKQANAARLAYEHNESDKSLKSASKQANKEYNKALKQNTTYRKGQVKHEVGSDLSRKYLSEAKKVKKQLDADPANKQLKKQYSKLMSKHDTERAKARRAPQVAERRMRKKASIKRSMTMTAKAVATTTAVTVGTMAVNAYLKKNNVKFNGMNINISQYILRPEKIL